VPVAKGCEFDIQTRMPPALPPDHATGATKLKHCFSDKLPKVASKSCKIKGWFHLFKSSKNKLRW
jgi:hypothetical protein